MRNLKKLFAVAICLSLSNAGCSFTNRLNSNFYAPRATPTNKMPAKVALVANPAFENHVAMEGTSGFGVFKLPTSPGYLNAVHSMLASLYEEVERVPNFRDAGEADFAVVVSTLYPDFIDLTFRSPQDKVVVARYKAEGTAMHFVPSGGALVGFVFISLLTLFIVPYAIATTMPEFYEARAREVEAITSKALDGIAHQIAADGTVTESVAAKELAEKLEAGGTAAARRGENSKAFAAYAKAARTVWFWGKRGRRLQENSLKLAARVGPPDVPEEAERHVLRGRALAKKAETTAGYRAAVEEFSKAVQLAPWSAPLYYNLGLALEAGGESQAAAEALKLYLVGSPDAEDEPEVKAKIAELEVSSEAGEATARDKRPMVDESDSAGGVRTLVADESAPAEDSEDPEETRPVKRKKVTRRSGRTIVEYE